MPNSKNSGTTKTDYKKTSSISNKGFSWLKRRESSRGRSDSKILSKLLLLKGISTPQIYTQQSSRPEKMSIACIGHQLMTG